MLEKTTKNTKLYWVLQICGWGVAAVYWSYYQVVPEVALVVGLSSVVLMYVVGLGSTHLYKQWAHTKGWISLNLQALLPRLILAWLVLSSIYVAASFTSTYLWFKHMSVDIFLGMFSGGTRYMAIWLLAFHLYHYARYNQRIETDQARLEQLALSAQLHQLNTQLNPHFLFNALNSIKALTIENPVASREAIDLLSALLRASLAASDQSLVTLQDEYSRSASYLALEKIRFEERLHYHFDIPKVFLSFKIPPLILYNLVENAVKHGLSQSKQPGRIRIQVRKIEDQLHLEVFNNGVLAKKEEGMGLKNIRQRLKLLYKEHASLSLEQYNDQEVLASICIPVKLLTE